MNVAPLKFKTLDGVFSLSVDYSIVEKILNLCKIAPNVETGGILVGQYNTDHDAALVTDISGPPEDSRKTHSTFFRGVKGLQIWLNHIWRSNREYYLGEWHYHPFASAEASSVDIHQLKENSENGPLVCPEPVLLIIGGDPNSQWVARAYIYPKGQSLCIIEMLEPIPVNYVDSTG